MIIAIKKYSHPFFTILLYVWRRNWVAPNAETTRESMGGFHYVRPWCMVSLVYDGEHKWICVYVCVCGGQLPGLILQTIRNWDQFDRKYISILTNNPWVHTKSIRRLWHIYVIIANPINQLNAITEINHFSAAPLLEDAVEQNVEDSKKIFIHPAPNAIHNMCIMHESRTSCESGFFTVPCNIPNPIFWLFFFFGFLINDCLVCVGSVSISLSLSLWAHTAISTLKLPVWSLLLYGIGSSHYSSHLKMRRWKCFTSENVRKTLAISILGELRNT